MEEEVYKSLTIRGVELEVSNFGNVRGDKVKLNKRVNPDGYYVVSINNRAVGVHRLVALTFIPNDNTERNEVNHKDFDRQNNHVSNLEWMTHSENVKYSWENGRYSPRSGESNPNYGNRKLSKFYKENPEISKIKQGRKGSRNGKAKSIELYKDGVLIEKFDYIGDCCKYLHENHGFSPDAEVIRCGIRRSMKRNVPYKGFTFVKQ